MSARAQFWRWRYARWAGGVERAEPGYTLLLPVPGDLPVFLELALAVCRLQDPDHRVETLVIPDVPTRAIAALVRKAQPDWPGRLELLRLPLLDRAILPRLGDPGRNHGAQLIRGVRAARATRVVLHDADLFLMDPRVHADEYERAHACGLDAFGVSPAWDPWYAGHGRELVATWELCARVAWLRSFAPHRHLGHDARIDGETHTFDTTFWPQWHTAPSHLAVGTGLAERVVHFNYTISTYRTYQRATGTFHDKNFRILLIRLFVELFGRTEHAYGLPTLPELAAGLGASGPTAAVRYLPEDGDAYRRMRKHLGDAVSGPWSSPARATRCHELLAVFDAYFEGIQGLP